MTLEEFYPPIRVMGEIFSNKLSPEATEIYYRLFKEYTKNEFQHAVMVLLKTYKYNCMPKPSEFIEIIQETRKKYKDNKKELPFYKNPTKKESQKIRKLVQGVVDKCKT